MSRRRSFGAIEKLPSSRWRARYTGPDRQMRSAPVTFKSKREAENWLTVTQSELLRGVWSPPEVAYVSLGEYIEAWLRQRAPQLCPRTRDLYRRLADRWLLAPVGEGHTAIDLSVAQMRHLSPALIREWHATVTQVASQSALSRGKMSSRTVHPARTWATSVGSPVAQTGRLSPATIDAWRAAGSPEHEQVITRQAGAGRTATAQAYRLLHAILATAVDDQVLTTNPARIAKGGHVDHAERIPLTPSEISVLAAAVPDRYRAALLVAAWSGLRPGEVFALTRRNVDLVSGTIAVRQTLVEVPGGTVTFGPPKSAAGHRTVALPSSVVEELAKHLSYFTNDLADALIFTSASGRPVTSGTRSRVLRSARTSIERPDITWHHLRHTGATIAAQAGATPAELMRRIGHSTMRAASRYQHASERRDSDLAMALNRFVRIDGIAAPPKAATQDLPITSLPDSANSES